MLSTEEALHHASALARLWLGATSPNPPVGALAFSADGVLLAEAAHTKVGAAHAEASLIEICKAKGLLKTLHTLVVTLEPCNHHGRTPPCTEAILQAGFKRVIIGVRDPNPHVTGGGIDFLKKAGIEVVVIENNTECRQLIHAFNNFVSKKKPWVTLKRVYDQNGSMIPPYGMKTFSSSSSLKLAHRLRKKSDAILTGSGTILADNPLFTVRHVRDHKDKRRWLAILDRRRRVTERSIEDARKRGLDTLLYENAEEALQDLVSKGVQDLLVEAGPQVSNVIKELDIWSMIVDIHCASTDTIDVQFNPRQSLGFPTDTFCWEYFLPNEDVMELGHD